MIAIAILYFQVGAVQGSKGYQISHLLRRSTFLYSSLWLNDSSEVQGMWLPTHWVRSRFEPTASSAKALRNGLAVSDAGLSLFLRM